MGFLKGRINRAVYWLCFGIFVAVYATMGALTEEPPTASTGVLILFFIYRLHDLGRTGWWSLAPFGVQVAIAIALGFSAAGLALSAAVLIVFVIALGAIQGQSDANRFGGPPLPGLKGAFKPMRS